LFEVPRKFIVPHTLPIVSRIFILFLDARVLYVHNIEEVAVLIDYGSGTLSTGFVEIEAHPKALHETFQESKLEFAKPTSGKAKNVWDNQAFNQLMVSRAFHDPSLSSSPYSFNIGTGPKEITFGSVAQ